MDETAPLLEIEQAKLIPYSEIRKRLAGNQTSKIPFATEDDLTKLQGGVPEVYEKTFENGNTMTYIIHRYATDKEGVPVVRSHKTLEDYGTSRHALGDKIIDFATALLWELHGGPCERESMKHGGNKYDRI